MARVLLVLIAALVIAGALMWLAMPSGTGRGLREEGRSRPADVVEPELPALAPVPAPRAERPDAPEPLSGSPEPQAARRESAATTREAELARAHWVDGRVLYPAGTPEDERVFVIANGKELADGSNHRVEVAHDGSFRVAFSEKTRSGRFELEARYLYLDEIVRWKGSKSSGEVVLEPELGARIAGRVRLPAGTDAGTLGGRLELEAAHRSGSSGETKQRGSLELSKSLEFSFDALPPGLDPELSYEVSYDGEAFIGRQGKLLPEAGKTLALELELRPGLVLAGIVRDETGAPVAEASVSVAVESSSASWTRANHRGTKSGADGSFRLGACESGEVELSARLAGYEPLQRQLGRLEAGASVLDLELVLARGGSISGTVRWPDGSPAEASLVLEPHGTGMSWTRPEVEGRSDASGAFSVSGLSEASYRVAARATKTEEVEVESTATGKGRPRKQRTHLRAEADRVDVGTKDLVLTLSTGLALAGRVVDDLGASIEDFWVFADRVESVTTFDLSPELTSSFRHTDGSFRMEGFAPGEWDLGARSKGHAPSEPVRVKLPGAGPVVLVVARESVVRGRVLDPLGAPVALASLAVEKTGKGFTASFESEDEAVADEQGLFEIDGLGPGRTLLQAHGSGFAPSERLSVELRAGEMLDGVVLRLRPGGTILGELFGADGRPQAGQGVSVSDHRGFYAHAEVGEDGRFRALGVPPGEIFLWAETLEGIHLQESVTLTEGETVRVRLAPGGGIVRLHGRVQAGGEPLAGARLHASRGEESGATASARTDEGGAYELRLPGPGRYRIAVQGDDGVSLAWSVTLEVPEVEELRFDVTIPVGRISGRVTDDERRGLAGLLVQSEPERHEGEAHGSARALTDAEGRYELVVPAGQHAVMAGGAQRWWFENAGQPYAEARVGNLSVGENGHVRGIDLVLTRGGILEGSVHYADGSSAPGVELWSEGRSLGWSDEHGRVELSGVAPGVHAVRARSRAGHASAPVTVEITAGETTRIEIELAAATRVRLSVRARGQQVGSDITVVDEHGRPEIVDTVENGEARVGPLLPGKYRIRAERDGKKIERELEVSGSEKEMSVELVFE